MKNIQVVADESLPHYDQVRKITTGSAVSVSGSLIASEEGLSLCSAGNPGMSTAGMGDILAGLIGGLIAQKVDLVAAAEQGVCIHAHAGDMAAAEGERGMIATDLLGFIRRGVNT